MCKTANHIKQNSRLKGVSRGQAGVGGRVRRKGRGVTGAVVQGSPCELGSGRWLEPQKGQKDDRGEGWKTLWALDSLRTWGR